MSDNDVISRGALVDYIKTYQCAKCSDIGLCGHCAVLIALKLIEDAPAVPHEMTAREFAKAFRRMCDSYDVNGHNSCEGCEVWRENICCLCDLPDIIPIVEKWAREHPERNE